MATVTDGPHNPQSASSLNSLGDSVPSDEGIVTRVLDDLKEIDRDVRSRIEKVIDETMSPWLDGDDPEIKAVLGSYRAMALTSGKRLRPAFVRWAFEGLGGDPRSPEVRDASVAVELLHTFALIHDDVMDEAVARRGVPTIHVTYADLHRSRRLRGDAVHHGNSIAILMGDLAFAHAALLMTGAPPTATSVFYQMCSDLMVGQYLDIAAAARGPVEGVEVADRIMELKTARYTVEGPLLLGAALAGRSDEMATAARSYGRQLGRAFQLRDDLLGAFGNPDLTGKPVGGDLAQGKVTRLIEVGLATCRPEDRPVLTRLGSDQMLEGDVERARRILVECGARAEIEQLIDGLLADAIHSVGRMPVTPEIRSVLIGAARLVAHREG
ncbi:MAG: polyprenyl synthetase family protein [Acidimicrobiales bacterium]|nr:polyprenyl synthetase family protein [Acidimicrobiales bacterium]